MVGQPNDVVRVEFQEGAKVFIAELLAMEESHDYRAGEILEVLIREAVGRYAFWRANNVAYHQSPPSLVTGRVSEAHVCAAVREITTSVRTNLNKESQQKFAIVVLLRMCPAPHAAR